MEIACILRDTIESGWSNDNKYYCIRRLYDGNGCSPSFSTKVLESTHQNSEIQRVS